MTSGQKKRVNEQHNSTIENVDVLIVGGGMAGGLLAALLAQTDLSFVLIDAASEPEMPQGDASARVSAITEASYNMLNYAGAWPHLPVSRLAPYQSMDVWDAEGNGRVTFDAASVQASELGWIVENNAITAALYQACTERNVDWRCHTRFESLTREHGTDENPHWLATLTSGCRIAAKLVVGADGARSMVRSHAGIAAAPKDSGHMAIVATVECERPHNACARQRFMETGPLAMLPLFGDQHQFSLVWSAPPEMVDRLMRLDAAEFSHALTQGTEEVLGDCKVVGARAAFPIQTLHASQYVAAGVALIGDAAHVVHPLAGQGINLGFLDAAVLAEEIVAAQKKGLGLTEPSVLGRYQRRRRGHNALMLNALNSIKAVFAQRDPGLRFLRNVGMRLVNRTPLAKSLFATEALGRHGDLPAAAKLPGS